jgi:hypothetical protein
MDRFWDMERRRLEDVARETAEKQRRERLMLAGVVFFVAFIVLLALALLIVNGLVG